MKTIVEYCNQISLNEYLSSKHFRKKLKPIPDDYDNPIRQLAKNLIDFVLKGMTISFKDVEELDSKIYQCDAYRLNNIHKDGESAIAFYKNARGLRGPYHGGESSDYVKTEIKTDKGWIFVQINLDPEKSTYDGRYHPQVGEIMSIDMSKEIMDVLFE